MIVIVPRRITHHERAEVQLIVWAVAKTLGEKVIVLFPESTLARSTCAAQVELARGNTKAVGGRIHLPGQRARLDLERTDVGMPAIQRESDVDRS